MKARESAYPAAGTSTRIPSRSSGLVLCTLYSAELNEISNERTERTQSLPEAEPQPRPRPASHSRAGPSKTV